MATVEQERARLAARLTELEAERGQVTFALRVLDRLDERPSRVTARREPRQQQDGGVVASTQAVAVGVIDHNPGRVFRLENLLPEMEAAGWGDKISDKENAVRSALSRAVSLGLIERERPGDYTSKHKGPPQDSASVGPHDVVTGSRDDQFEPRERVS